MHCARTTLVMLALAVMGVVTAATDVCDADAGGQRDHRQTIVAGVNTIARPGVPGPLVVFGPDAFVVAAAPTDQGVDHPVVAGAAWGRGRVVAFGHGGFFSADALRTGDTASLLANAVTWARGETALLAMPNVGVVEASAVADLLEARGMTVQRLARHELTTAIDDVDVLVADERHYRDNEAAIAIARCVQRGGGLVTASLGWGWMQLNPGRDLTTDHVGNRLLAPAGIMWADGYLRATDAGGFAITGPPRATHALAALDLLEQQRNEPNAVSDDDAAQAGAVLLNAMRTVPADDRHLRPRVARLLADADHAIVVSDANRLGPDRALARVMLAMQIDAWLERPTRRHPAHPAASAFPGDVPDSARPVRRRVSIDPSTHGWHSTGCYAPPGARIEARVPADLAEAGLRLRIGAHKDPNWHHRNWRRPPQITVSHPVTRPVTRLTNPFGGLIYIEIPDRCDAAPFVVTINRIIDAPRYVHGHTSLVAWRDEIRHHPAPWAELASDRVILTVPSDVIRNLDDPAALMDHWNDVMDACADLATIDRARNRPERYVADVQISAGYMHAGYPIMTHLDAAPVMVDRDALRNNRSPTWGLYHEVGHNHQHPDWTFSGTGEVTVNLFTLYVLEEICGMPVSTGHAGIRPGSRNAKMRAHLDAGAPFDAWKRDPFLALIMYVQLREAFGWEAYQRVFAEYRDLPANERPRDDDAKRDQWMVRFSHAVGHNLGPFFQAWGVPTSDAARATLADLPVWMPEAMRDLIVPTDGD